jgi:GT2 family glycosyltransferase
MYLGHLTAFSRAAWERSGGFRSEYDGAQDYDLVLRLTDGPVKVHHLPSVLYHWRRHAGSTAANPAAKPYTHAAGKKALEDAIRRRSAPAEVEDGPRPNLYRIRWKTLGTPLASLIICSRSAKLLRQCLEAIAGATGYSRREIIVVQHLGQEDDLLKTVIQAHGARAVPYRGAFHFSRMNNLGAGAAAGDILVSLNDDVEPLDATWLERLIGQVQRPNVGVAGARLLYASGTVQHAGITIGIGDGCGHAGRGAYLAPYWPWLDITRDVSAVTGACLAIRTELFRDLNGFAEEFPINYNDTDLCLRVRDAGYRVIFDSAVVLRHHECQTRRGGVTLAERQRWYERWSDFIDAGDPFYSPHLTREREDLSLR